MHYDIEKFIDEVLAEDIVDPSGKIPTGDHSSLACLPDRKNGRAQLLCKADGILAGIELAELICKRVDTGLKFEKILSDATHIRKGDIAFKIHNSLHDLKLI